MLCIDQSWISKNKGWLPWLKVQKWKQNLWNQCMNMKLQHKQSTQKFNMDHLIRAMSPM